jgi:hypothetical protein
MIATLISAIDQT